MGYRAVNRRPCEIVHGRTRPSSSWSQVGCAKSRGDAELIGDEGTKTSSLWVAVILHPGRAGEAATMNCIRDAVRRLLLDRPRSAVVRQHDLDRLLNSFCRHDIIVGDVWTGCLPKVQVMLVVRGAVALGLRPEALGLDGEISGGDVALAVRGDILLRSERGLATMRAHSGIDEDESVTIVGWDARVLHEAQALLGNGSLATIGFRLAMMRKLSVVEQLTVLFEQLARDCGRPIPAGIQIAVELTDEFLARYVCRDRTSVAHAMTKLVRHGMILRSSHSVVVCHRRVVSVRRSSRDDGEPTSVLE